MLIFYNLKGISPRKLLISTVLLGFTFFTFASIGGDKNKSKKNSLQSGFTPIRTTRGFTLRDGLNYRGSLILKHEKTADFISYNSLITYQKGNVTYILPNRYRAPLKSEQINLKSNLQLLQLKIKLCK